MKFMEEIVKRLQKGDRKAQKQIYDKYSGLFYAICLRYASNTDEAWDLLQEGFIRIFFNIKSFKGKGSFEGWMKRIVINNAINHYYKDKKYRYHEDIDENYEIKSEDRLFDDADFTYEELLEIIRQLPSGYRTIFNLYAIEGYKHKEIAKILGISESTSKSQYHRAKKILQKILKDIKKKRNG